MKLAKIIQHQFLKTPVFKGLVNEFQKQNDSKIVPNKELKTFAKASQDKIELEKSIPVIVNEKVTEEIQKIDTMNKNQARRFRFPDRVNSYVNPNVKPGADISFLYMRRMAQIYPIARACINRRIRQITQLDWEITTIDEIDGEEGFDTQIKMAKDFFKHPMGPNTRLREFLTMIVDDLLTIDAISFEYQKTRAGEFMSLVPVDPTTIALRVTETGATPEPPDPAYVQIIQGEEIARFTTEEMLYDFMGNRTYSPYGFAPLESLILQAESAIRGALYNLDYFRENNVPEGFIALPDDVATTKEQVEEYQMWFDALLSGDRKMTHRLKFLPGGATYTPAKKPEDMAFERFELWLLQQTCAVFDVQPQDIGITLDVNKSTSKTQSDIGKERGLIPLTKFIKEMFDDLVQEKFGLENLQFIWGNINPVDEKDEAEVAKIAIDRGMKSVDEIRITQGLEPIGLSHFIMSPQGPMFVKDLISGKVGPRALVGQDLKPDSGTSHEDKDKDKKKDKDGIEDRRMAEFEKMEYIELTEIRRWRKCIYRDIEAGRPLRKHFPTEDINPKVHAEIAKGLEAVSSKMQAKVLFDAYLDNNIKASLTLLKHARELRAIEHEPAFA